MADITFLHTSPVHVPTFEQLLAEVAPSLTAEHRVRADLLARAQRDGVDAPELVAAVRGALGEAARGARAVVCTCSTLGGLAEDAGADSAVPITRVDRAMADEAVRHRTPVLMVAALQSTLGPTAALLQSSAERCGVKVVLQPLWVQDAWPHFEAGRHADYIESIVSAVVAARHAGVVVLAQASMAPAALALSTRGITALTSPRLGVQHAVQLLQAGRHAAASTTGHKT